MDKLIQEYSPEYYYSEMDEIDTEIISLRDAKPINDLLEYTTKTQPDSLFHNITELDFYMFDIMKSIYSKERSDVILELFIWIEIFTDSETSTAILSKKLDEKYMADHIDELKQKIYQNFENYSYHEISFEYLNDALKLFGNRDCSNYFYAREVRYLVKDFYQMPCISFFKNLFRKGYIEDMIYYMYNPYEIWYNLLSSSIFID